MPLQEIFDNILNRRLDWPESGMSAECRDLIDRLLQTDPDMRLGHSGSQALKEHPWFAGLDWDNLAEPRPPLCPSSTARATPATLTPKRSEDTSSEDSAQPVPSLQHDARLATRQPAAPVMLSHIDGPCCSSDDA